MGDVIMIRLVPLKRDQFERKRIIWKNPTINCSGDIRSFSGVFSHPCIIMNLKNHINPMSQIFTPRAVAFFLRVFSEEWNVPINEAPKIKDLGKLSYNSNPWTFWTFFFWGDSLPYSNHQHLGVTLPRKSYKIFLNQTWRGDFFVGSPQLLGRKNQGITQIQWDTTSDLALGGSLTNFTTHSQFSWGYKNTGKKRTNTSSKVGFTWFFMESLYNCWQI